MAIWAENGNFTSISSLGPNTLPNSPRTHSNLPVALKPPLVFFIVFIYLFIQWLYNNYLLHTSCWMLEIWRRLRQESCLGSLLVTVLRVTSHSLPNSAPVSWCCLHCWDASEGGSCGGVTGASSLELGLTLISTDLHIVELCQQLLEFEGPRLLT